MSGTGLVVAPAHGLQVRENRDRGVQSRALYSTCGAYRYLLERRWSDGPTVNFVMLNPSTADERANDPTVERCERRARRMGYDAFAVTNIFAWRATDPRNLRSATDPVGPENDAVLIDVAQRAGLVIAAWGVHAAYRARGRHVAEALDAAGLSLTHLGLSRQGHPRHPLYLPYSASPVRWEAPYAAA